MAKVTVYVPDELWKRAQEQNEQVNLSQVFQEALKSELRRALRLQALVDLDARLDIAALRERFTRQRTDLYRRGYAIGLDAVQRYLNYAELRFCEDSGWDVDMIMRSGVYDDRAFDELMDVQREIEQEDYAGIFGTAMSRGVGIEVSHGFVAALRRAWYLATDDLMDEEHPDHRDSRDASTERQRRRRAAEESGSTTVPIDGDGD